MIAQRKTWRNQLVSRSSTSRRTGPWEPEEDERLLAIVAELGVKHWKLIGIRHGIRDGKQCRERWHNHLNPELIYGPLTPEEDEQILTYYSEMGTKWAMMSQLLRRPANLIKNRYYSSLSKKRDRMVSDSENSSCCSPRSRKRIKAINSFKVSKYEIAQFKKPGKVKISFDQFDHHKVSEQQTDYYRNHIDIPKTLACSNGSTFFELSMNQEQVSLLTSTYTPVSLPEKTFYHGTALDQLADLAIKNASSQEFHKNTKKYDIMSISAVLN
ncbi:4675_t:CDS:2 [Funneliformis caledonium]|uniref:4675_t:CDS:1 n=2 Tax=Funneliformis TaxID=1117308 RepID=A0A9N8ZLS5_9GLOM|nr:4675_t:CDS:2 [Funneliformis caledonium]